MLMDREAAGGAPLPPTSPCSFHTIPVKIPAALKLELKIKTCGAMQRLETNTLIT